MGVLWQHSGWWWVALAVPLAVLLALLARRRRRRVVPSLLPWQPILALPRPRPRRNWFEPEVFLSALIALAAAGALMGFTVSLERPMPPHVAILLDTSMSMQERTGAVRAAVASLVAANRDARWSLVESDAMATPVLVEAAAGDILGSLETLSHSVQSCSGQAARAQAWWDVQGDAFDAVFWIGDAPAPVESTRIRSIVLPALNGNVGILRAGMDWTANPPSAWLAVVTEADAPWTSDLEVSYDEAPPVLLPVVVEARGAAEVVIDVPAGVRTMTARLAGDAGVAWDNTVTLSVQPLRVILDPVRFPRLTLALVAAGATIVQESDADGDALVVAGRKEPAVEHADWVVAPASAMGELIDLQPPRRITRVRVMSESVSEVAAEGLEGVFAPLAILPPGAEVLIAGQDETGRVPLVATWRESRAVRVYIAALPDRWTAQAGFAILIAELLERTRPGRVVERPLEEVAPPRDVIAQAPSFSVTGKSGIAPISLARICAFVSAVCCGILAWRERKRLVPVHTAG